LTLAVPAERKKADQRKQFRRSRQTELSGSQPRAPTATVVVARGASGATLGPRRNNHNHVIPGLADLTKMLARNPDLDAAACET